MRVIHYTPSLSRTAGGLYYSVSGLAKAQRELGAEVRVVGWADPHFDEDRLAWGDLPLHAMRTARIGHGLSWHARKTLSELRPDVVHVHGIWNASSIYGLLAAFRGTTVIVSPRGMLDPWITRRSRLKKAVHGALFERPLLKRARIHFLSEQERDAALPFVGASAVERSFVVPNGMDIHASRSLDKSGFIFIGRLHEKKQVLELIQRWPRQPDFLRLIVAGWGDDAYTRHISTATADHPNVEFAGSLYGDAKAVALESARFSILPSLSEGLPMAVLESLAHGCIPLITRECNLPELIESSVALEIASDFSDFDRVLSRATSMRGEDLDAASASSRVYSMRYGWPNLAARMLENYAACPSANYR